MIRTLEDYRRIVGDEVISGIYRKARRLYGKHVLHINSTAMGGGVAEILSSLLPLFNEVGVDSGWRILHGHPDFFAITKKFHNALQGETINFSRIKQQVYTDGNERFSTYTHVDHDCIVIHDPQPLALIGFLQKRQPWIWRCHVDLSQPDGALWEFLKQYILRYDLVVVSSEEFRKPDLPVEQRVMCPAIDPLAAKNQELSARDVAKYLKKFRIPTDRPIMTQVSRFDKWKDPLGVLRVFERVREEANCRLVLCGSMAPDDPEGWGLYQRVTQKAGALIRSGDVVLVTSENNILVNALQSSSAVVVQKSLREGFGLTVTEALWKGKPVVASNVGGIRLQIEDGRTGFLLDPYDEEGFARTIVDILRDPEKGRSVGHAGAEAVKERFLITRLLSDYLDIIRDVIA